MLSWRDKLRQARENRKRAKEGRRLEAIADDDISTLEMAAREYRCALQPEDSHRIALRILDLDPTHPEAFLRDLEHKEWNLKEKGLLADNLELLIGEYEKLRANPRRKIPDDQIDYKIAWIAYEAKNYQLALEFMERDPDPPQRHRSQYAECLFQCGRYEDACIQFRDLEHGYRDFGNMFSERYAEALEKCGRLEEAREARYRADCWLLLLKYNDKRERVPMHEAIRNLNNHLLLTPQEADVFGVVYPPIYAPKMLFRTNEEACHELNHSALFWKKPATWTPEMVDEIVTAALAKLGTTREEFLAVYTKYRKDVKVISTQYETEQQTLLHDKYPDVLKYWERQAQEEREQEEEQQQARLNAIIDFSNLPEALSDSELESIAKSLVHERARDDIFRVLQLYRVLTWDEVRQVYSNLRRTGKLELPPDTAHRKPADEPGS